MKADEREVLLHPRGAVSKACGARKRLSPAADVWTILPFNDCGVDRPPLQMKSVRRKTNVSSPTSQISSEASAACRRSGGVRACGRRATRAVRMELTAASNQRL